MEVAQDLSVSADAGDRRAMEEPTLDLESERSRYRTNPAALIGGMTPDIAEYPTGCRQCAGHSWLLVRICGWQHLAHLG